MSNIALCADGNIKLCADGNIKLGCAQFLELNFSGIALTASGSAGYASITLPGCSVDGLEYTSSSPTVLTSPLSGSVYYAYTPLSTVTASPIGPQATGLSYVAWCTQTPGAGTACAGQPSFKEQFCVRGAIVVTVAAGGVLNVRGDVKLFAYGYGGLGSCHTAGYHDSLAAQSASGILLSTAWTDLTTNLIQTSNVFSLSYGTMRVRIVNSVPGALYDPCNDWV
jgi:hypothetical protein